MEETSSTHFSYYAKRGFGQASSNFFEETKVKGKLGVK
jgi:hypothetical protein